jgi:hypothetical protein
MQNTVRLTLHVSLPTPAFPLWDTVSVECRSWHMQNIPGYNDDLASEVGNLLNGEERLGRESLGEDIAHRIQSAVGGCSEVKLGAKLRRDAQVNRAW